MKGKTRFVFGLILFIAITGPMTFALDNDAKTDEATKKDLKLFEGTWQITSLEIDGNKAGGDDIKKIRVVNEADGMMAIEVDGMPPQRGMLKIYPTQKPKMVDLTATEGDGKGKTMLGIYEFDGDTRKVCYAPTDKERPTDFTAAAGSGRFLVVLKRIKK